MNLHPVPSPGLFSHWQVHSHAALRLMLNLFCARNLALIRGTEHFLYIYQTIQLFQCKSCCISGNYILKREKLQILTLTSQMQWSPREIRFFYVPHTCEPIKDVLREYRVLQAFQQLSWGKGIRQITVQTRKGASKSHKTLLYHFLGISNQNINGDIL